MLAVLEVDGYDQKLSAWLDLLLEEPLDLFIVIVLGLHKLRVQECVEHYYLIFFRRTQFLKKVEHKIDDSVIEVSLGVKRTQCIGEIDAFSKQI